MCLQYRFSKLTSTAVFSGLVEIFSADTLPRGVGLVFFPGDSIRFSQLIEVLAPHGLRAKQLRWGLATGRISRSVKDANGNFAFREKHIRQARWYADTARPGKPPPTPAHRAVS